MITLIIILSIFCLMLVITAYFSNRAFMVIEKRQMKETTKESLVSILVEEAKKMRVCTQSGSGMNSVVYYREIAKANRLITRKIERKEPISESEKWLYENFYLAYRFIYSAKDDLSSIPHVDDVPRIVKLARIIVDNSLGDLTSNRINYLMSEIKTVCQLTFAELSKFNEAIGYAIIEQLFILSQRLIYDNKCKISANKYGFDKKKISSDVYLFHLIHSNKDDNDTAFYMEKNGIDGKNINVNYNFVLVKNTIMAETLFGALANINMLLPIDKGIRFLSAYQILSNEKTLQNISTDTLINYFNKIEKISKRCKVSEDYVSKMLIEFSYKIGKDISIILFDLPGSFINYIRKGKVKVNNWNKLKESLYAVIILFSAVLMSVMSGYFLNSIIIGILSFIPYFFLSDNIINYLLSFVNTWFDSPSMNFKSVSYENNTMVVISEFIGSIEQLKNSIFHAETILDGNKDKNISVGLLIDTKADKVAITDLDREIIEYLQNMPNVENLNIFLRKKTYSNKKFIAKERKRGAIMALSKLLLLREDFEFLYIKNKDFLTPKYIVTLDADSTLLPGEILRMVNMMAHPYNAKYDLLSMESRNNLYSIDNLYSIRYLFDSGFENYPNYTGIYFKLFHRDIYCGKGIYRLERFYNQLEEIFPSNKILSHDILEGSVLNTGSGGLCFEDAPNNFISDRERRKRWQRGDIQLMPFLFGLWKNDDKIKCKGEISPLGKYIIIKNIIGNLKDLVLLALFIFGLCSSFTYLLFALGIFIAPYFVNQIKILRGNASRIKTKKIIILTLKNIYTVVEDFFMLSYYAIDNIIILSQTLYKMMTKKNLLEWKTFYSSQCSHILDVYVKEFSIPSLVLTVTTGILWLIGYPMLIAFLSIIGSYIIYLMLYYYPQITYRKQEISSQDKELLLDLGKSTYKYFCYMRRENGLIGDNLQIKPYKGEAKTTSPTNLGFSILAEICAFYLGVISITECAFNIEKIIIGIEKLKKWQGNLYNWYDIKTENPINQFVSSVDNGNLVAILLLTKEFLMENSEEILALKIELIVKNIRLDQLFDKNKNLFFIGYDGEKYVGHYDLLASESRILSFVYIALFNDYNHYSCLQKDYIGHGGNILLSWSGTMFEMLMADIFFQTPRFSTLYKSAKYTVKKQVKNSYNGIWGVSESGYHLFDSDLKYQYSAFGIDKLALSSNVRENIISPYASILALRYAPIKVLDNIKKLKEYGAMYEYGMFESIDFSKNGQIVYSSMSHHQGMIIASITNFLNDNILTKLIKKTSKINSVLTYFNDMQPNIRFSYKRYEKQRKYTENKNNYYKNIDKIDVYYNAFVLSDTQYNIICNSLGGGNSLFLNKSININNGIYEENNGIFFYASEDGKEWKSPTLLPLKNDKYSYNFSCSGEEIFYSSTNGLKENITIIPSVNGEVRKLIANKEYSKVSFYFDLCLCEKNEYLSHPTFRGFFISIKKVANNIVLATCKQPGKINEKKYLAVRVESVKNIEWECNRLNYIGRGKSLTNPIFLNDSNANKNIYPSLGDVLSPCIGFKADFISNTNQCQVAIIYGKNEQEILQTIMSLPINIYGFALQSIKPFVLSEIAQNFIGPLLYCNYENKMLQLLFESEKFDSFMNYCKGKKILQYHFDEKKSKNLYKFADIISELRAIGIDVFIAVYSTNRLTKNNEDFIIKIFESKRIINYSLISELQEEKYWAFLNIDADFNFINKEFKFSKVFQIEKTLSDSDEKIELPDIVFKSGEGGFDFCNNYIVSKKTKMPYSNIIGGKNGGILVTSDGDGFFYFGNSREDKAVRFDNDYVIPHGGERVYVKTILGSALISGGISDSSYSIIEKGIFTHKYEDKSYKSNYMVSVLNDGAIKLTQIEINKKTNDYIELIYCLYPSLNWKYEPGLVISNKIGNIVKYTNVINKKTMYMKILGANAENLAIYSENEIIPYFEYFCEKENEKLYVVFSPDLSLIHSLNIDNIEFLKEKSQEYFNGISNIDIVSSVKSFNYLINFLPYQIMSSRINAKSGFYQVGGAKGFRDQLQDSLAFFSNTEIIKEHIIDCCKHQYELGDVMHWWHQPKYGLRTRITDDKLFLPYAVCQYIKYSDDHAFLQNEYPYLSSNQLSPEENDRFENPPYTEYTETVFKHCLRAIRSALRYGEHKLLIMGTGDWNDGMDKICKEGKGESIFNSMFCYLVLSEFADLCPEDLKNEMYNIAVELKNAINIYGYEDDRYKRLYSDSGKWLGSKRSNELELDLLVQAFAVISKIADGERALICLQTAEQLIDKKAGIIKLLTPALDEKEYLGYISDYPKGIRENGGQYTHSAMWYLIALVMVGRQDDAFDLFQMINPVEKCSNQIKNDMYMCEPYVLSGDVYSNKANYGRGGWSWYTGSASWAYKLVTEYFYGLKKRGDNLFIEPNLPKKLENSTVIYKYKNSSYIIEYQVGLYKKIMINGKETDRIILEENVRQKVIVDIGH